MNRIEINNHTADYDTLCEDGHDDVFITTPWDDDVECTHCGESVEQDPDGDWVHEGTGKRHCDTDEVVQYAEEERYDLISGLDKANPSHDPPFVNGASLHFSSDAVLARISVGDPRGAFVMKVERCADGELRLSVPHPSDPMPHMGLSPLASPGYYKVGPSSGEVVPTDAVKVGALIGEHIREVRSLFEREESGVIRGGLRGTWVRLDRIASELSVAGLAHVTIPRDLPAQPEAPAPEAPAPTIDARKLLRFLALHRAEAHANVREEGDVHAGARSGFDCVVSWVASHLRADGAEPPPTPTPEAIVLERLKARRLVAFEELKRRSAAGERIGQELHEAHEALSNACDAVARLDDPLPLEG